MCDIPADAIELKRFSAIEPPPPAVGHTFPAKTQWPCCKAAQREAELRSAAPAEAGAY